MLKNETNHTKRDSVVKRNQWRKMAILGFACILYVSLFIANRVFAAQCGDAETTLIECGDNGSGNIVHVLSTVLDIMTMGIGILAVIGISIFGVQYLTAGDDTNKVAKAKRRMFETSIGVVCYLALFGATKWLLPNGTTNLEELEQRLAALTISVGGPKTVGETFTPQVTLNEALPQSKSIPSKAQPNQTDTVAFKLATSSNDNKAAKTPLSFQLAENTSTDTQSAEEVPTVQQQEATPTEQPPQEVAPAEQKPEETPVEQSQEENSEGKQSTVDEYSLVSTNPEVVAVLGKHAKCSQAGESKLVVVDKNGQQASTEVTCEEPVATQDPAPVKPKTNKPAIRKASDGTDTVGNMEKTRLRNGKPHLRAKTISIINAHNMDFTYKTYKKVIKSKGGLISYIQRLDGVFNAYGKRINKNGNIARAKVATAADLQAAAEFVYGLFMIWGPDYDSGQVHHDWNGKDAFYKGLPNRKAIRGYSGRKIQQILQRQLNNTDDFRTSCNTAINTFNKSTTLADMDGASHKPKTQLAMSRKNYNKNKGKITRWSDLRVGDIVHFFAANGSWRHVAMVGEVYSDYIVFYDGGSRFMKNRQYKFAIPRKNDKKLRGTYKSYASWWGFRPWKIDQSVTLKGIN